MLLDQVRASISAGKIKEAIKLLQDLSSGYEDELAIHLMQLSMLEKNNRLGIIGYKTFQSQITKTSLSVLQIAKQAMEEGLIIEIRPSFVPKEKGRKFHSQLERKWVGFFDFVSWSYLVEVRRSEKWIADFVLLTDKDVQIEVEVKGIQSINDLQYKSRYIKPEIPNTPLSNCLILAMQPFLSPDGFYKDSKVIQLGWVYNYDENDWDNLVLKSNYDISNTKSFIYDLLKSDTNYKSFMAPDMIDLILEEWKKF